MSDQWVEGDYETGADDEQGVAPVESDAGWEAVGADTSAPSPGVEGTSAGEADEDGAGLGAGAGSSLEPEEDAVG